MNARTKILIAALAALGAMSQYAQAEALPYKNIKLCDGVTLKNDSPKQWGCWTKFAPPAAGPTPVGYLADPTSQPYLPPVNPVQPTSSCAAGSMCGYAIYSGFGKVGVASSFTVTGTGYTMLLGNGSTYTGVLSNTAPFVMYTDPSGVFIASKNDPVNNTSTFNNQGFLVYVSGVPSKGYYVAGVPTNSSQLTTLTSNAVTASYSGHEILTGGAVKITANFGSGTWNGAWASNVSGSTVNWSASGTISGGAITSNALGGAAQSGYVKGTFYGATAQNLAGVSNVALTGPVGTVTHADLFVTAKQ